MAIGNLIKNKDTRRYILQYLFLIGIIFVGVPLIFGSFTVAGFWLNFIVVHLLFARLIQGNEKVRKEKARKKRLRDLTKGKGK